MDSQIKTIVIIKQLKNGDTMKKEEILRIRVMSVAVILALMAVILVAGPGSTLFKGIVDNINNNVVDINSSQASIYNLCFYKGLDTVYNVLFSIGLFSTCMAAAGIVTKYRGASVYAVMSCISMILTSVYIIAAYMLQGSVSMHRFIAGFYLDNVSSGFETASLINVSAVVCSVLIIILSVLALLMIKSSRIQKIEEYMPYNRSGYYMSVAVVAFAAIYMEWLRPVLIDHMCESDMSVYTAVSFVNDYYFAGKWFLNMPFVWFVTIPLVILMLSRGKVSQHIKSRRRRALTATLIPAVVIIIRMVIYMINPPSLFGYLTMDEHICDITQAAFVPYMIMFLLDVVMLAFITYVAVNSMCSAKHIIIAIALNVIAGIIAMFVVHMLAGGVYVAALLYIVCMLADVVPVVYIWFCIKE